MKRTMILIAGYFLLSNFAFARIIIVDNKYPYAGQYQTLQEAHNSANTGDSIYVSPSIIPYSAITISKQLVLIGVGFDIDENIGGAHTYAASISGQMTFVMGSSGSIIEGFDGSFDLTAESRIIIKRNDLYGITIRTGGSGSSVIQNVLSYLNLGDANNVLITNNKIIYHAQITYAIIGGIDIILKNNVFCIGGYYVNSGNGYLFVNNIFANGLHRGIPNSLYFNNMSWYNSLPEGNGNLNNIDMNDVFISWHSDNSHTIRDFHLLPTSPARGSGQNGADMGIYGGEEPYVDCGFPGIPSILQLEGDLYAAPGTGLNIKFRAKSNK